MQSRISQTAMLGLAATAVMGASPPSAHPGLSALQGLERGEWELRSRDDDAAPRRLCLGDPRQLLQLHHPRSHCRSFVVSDTESAGTVTYDCAGAGGGRTDVRVETPRLVQLRVQGVSEGAPFIHDMEGRRIGACSSKRVAPSPRPQ